MEEKRKYLEVVMTEESPADPEELQEGKTEENGNGASDEQVKE
jgi:hypothetical protein